MGRNRKDGDPLGLAGTRLALRNNTFYYRHRDGRWEGVGSDIKAAKTRAALYRDPNGVYGTTAYWLDMFIVDCETRVKASTLSARTVEDYRANVEPLKVFFGRMPPEHIRPADVQTYLEEGKRQGRAVRANRERACLSSCLSWLLRTGETTLTTNPCMRASGVKRNPETPRDRYVTHAEYHAVFEAAPRQVQLMMALVPESLAAAQRPGMTVHIGSKAIRAKAMTRQAYNDLRGWALPADEDGTDAGMLVEYLDGGKANVPGFDGYVSWSPIDVFNRAYPAI